MLLRLIIVILALADGALHLWLNQALFRGNFFGPQQFPSPFPLQMNHMFTLNFIGYVVLASLFWFGGRLLGAKRWLIDVALIVLAALSLFGWLKIGAPNPMGLGYISKVIEVALIAALGVHLWTTRRAKDLNSTQA
jgi:hypothetical protein